MKTLLKRLLTFLGSLTLLTYVFMQLYPLFYSSVSSEVVNTYTAYEMLTVDCVAIRNETTVPLNTSNYVYYTVQNGTRVANGGTIAEIYTGQNDALVKKQLAALDEELSALQDIETLGSSGIAGLDILNTQISLAMEELVQDSDAATMELIATLRQRLVTLINKKQVVTGKDTDFSARIAALQAQRSALQGANKAAAAVVKAPVAGYFVNTVDGMEGLLKVQNVADMTTDNVRTALQTQFSGGSTAYAGKIVGDYAWYLACVVPGTYATALAKDKSLYVRLPFVTDEEIPVTVVGCNRDAEGNLAVIFECVNMSEALSSIRHESMEILLVKHKGLRVPNRAITTDAEQHIGVYIRAGDVVRFRRIEQEYGDAADYVICKENGQSGYLRLYDDVITEGSNLYDGKLIR